MFFFFFKQKTAYERRISDWSSDVCSSDLEGGAAAAERLIRLNRLEAIEDLRPKSAAQVETADVSLTAAGKAAQQASEQLATGRTALSRADQVLREALRAADEAALALERLNGKREQLDSRLNEARTYFTSASAEHDAAKAGRSRLPEIGRASCRERVCQYV